MARSSNAFPFLTLGVVVVAAAFGVGYYVLGGPRPTPATVAAPPPTPVQAPAAIKSPAPQVTVRTKNTNYTAPGAPAIQITEDPTPTVKRVTRPAVSTLDATSDPEASQESTPPPPPADIVVPPSSDSTTPMPSSGSSPDSKSTSADTTSTPAPSTPSDPDFEQTGGKASTTPSSDSEASQQAPKASFRVQTGSFAAPQNAKALADALRQRGYVTSTRAEQDGDRTVYKVQIGAYRTKAAADKAALDLQKDGYPAYSSPITP